MDASFWNDRYSGASHVYGEELLMTLADLRGELAGLEFQIARELERDVTLEIIQAMPAIQLKDTRKITHPPAAPVPDIQASFC